MEEQLRNLAIKENAIIEIIKSIIGPQNIKEASIKQLGLFEMYVDIHEKYTNLNCIESLKRAIFIQWYGAFEPSIYTGISDLDTENEMKNLNKLIELIKVEKLDVEFISMISHYYSLSEWYFNIHKDWEVIKKIATKEKNKVLWNQIQNMNMRGQMGVYWNSLRKQ